MTDQSNGDDRQDQTPPSVQSVSPTGAQTDLITNAEATFSEAMNKDSVEAPGNFTLTEQGTTQPLDAQVSYDPQTNKATLDPKADLKANTIYTATVKGGTSGVKKAPADIPLAADKSWSFATAAPIPETTGPALNFRFARLAVFLGAGVYVVTIFALIAFTGTLDSAATATAFGALLTFIGTLAGAYFGIKSTQDTTDKARAQVEEANTRTERANKRTERAYQAER